MRLLKQATAASVMVLMVDSTDHVTGKTGLTLTITASKNGAAFASISPTVNERGSGWYELQLTTAHTDTLGDLALHVTGAAADPTDTLSYVVPRHLADLAFPATSGRSLAVEADGMVHGDLKEWLGVAPFALDAQRVVVDVDHIRDDKINSDSFDASAITAAALATDAVTEIQAGLALEATAQSIKGKTDNLPSDPADESILEAAIAGVLADTNDIQSRLPAALVSGKMDSTIGAVAASALTAAAFAAGAINANALANDAVEEIAMKVLTWASSNWESSAGVKSLGAAVMKAVHRIRDNAGTLEIFRADGTTLHASQTVTTDDTLKPIDELSGAA
jgi:hypothetical protein